MKEPLREKCREWLRALTNPRLLFCLAVGWFLTNGWAYCFMGVGVYLGIDWMRNAASVYLGLLWFPGTPEKLLTVGIAVGLLQIWFPEDERTLALLKDKQQKLWKTVQDKYRRFRQRLQDRKRK